MSRSPRSTFAAAGVGLALTLAACSSDDSEPAASAPPAAAEEPASTAPSTTAVPADDVVEEVELVSQSAGLVPATPSSESASLTLEAGAVLMIEYSSPFTVPAELAGTDPNDYYASVEPDVVAAGGEVLGLWDLYDVPEGMIDAEHVALVSWPDMEAFRSFRMSEPVAAENQNLHLLRGFFEVPESVTIPVSTDLYYEWFGISFDPADAALLQDFVGVIGPPNQGVGAEYGQNFLLATLAQLDVPENTWVTDFAGLVEWPSATHIRVFEESEAFTGAVEDLRNQASERIDMMNGRWLAPSEWRAAN